MSTVNRTNTSTTPSATQRPSLSGVLEPRVGCIAGAMEIIGNKWTALILRDLTAGPKRFGELEKSLGSSKHGGGCSPRTLSQRLDDLESHGIISRGISPQSPARCSYSLTAKGEDLVPILKQMAVWGAKYYCADS